LSLYTRQTFPQQAGSLYSTFDSLMQGVGQVPLTNTMKTLGAPMARFPSSPELGAALTNPKLQSLSDTLTKAGGTLTFPELQELRSAIGRSISDPTLINDIPRSDLKNVYRGISADLESAAANQSPEALDAFQRANQFYGDQVKTIDALSPLLSGSPEQSFAKINQAAGSTAGANVALLRQAQSVMPADDWNNVGAAVIRRLGEPPPSAQNALQTPFSASSFATNWNKLSDAAKDVLFGPDTAGSNRSDLEALARVAQAQKNVAGLANTSQSAGHLILGGAGALLGERVFEDPGMLLSHLGAAVGGAVGARLNAQALMSPGFARWLYQMPANYAQAPSAIAGAQRVMGGLQDIIRANPQLAPLQGAMASVISPAMP
jgi:hypothetical protein